MSAPYEDEDDIKRRLAKEKFKAEAKRLSQIVTKRPILSSVILLVFIFICWHAPAWERKYQLYSLLDSDTLGGLCLSHENSIFERSGIAKAYATTDRFLRFDKQTFLRDFLKEEDSSIQIIAVAMDLDGYIYWSEMSLKENQKLSDKFKIALGTCMVAPNFHRNIPGSALVTNQ